MTTTRAFPAVPASVAAARRFTTDALAGIAPEALETAELLVSELATNCIRHVGTGFELTIRSSATEIRVEVTDHGGGEPQMRHPKPTDVSGRGLRIVDVLSERWGVEQAAGAEYDFETPAAGNAVDRRDDGLVEVPGVIQSGKAADSPV